MLTGKSPQMVRFHHESVIPEAHQHMMVGSYIYRNHVVARGIEFLTTCQFSARPHLATIDFYRRVLECFTPQAKTFVEDKMHGVCHEAYKLRGDAGWREWPIGIYAPADGNLKRSYHLDGRAGGPKFDDQLVF